MHKTNTLTREKYALSETSPSRLSDALKNLNDKLQHLHDAKSMQPGTQRDQSIKNYSSSLNKAKGLTLTGIRHQL